MDTYRNLRGQDGIYLLDFSIPDWEENLGTNPKGHLNFSRAKQIEMYWTSDNDCSQFMVMASSINFLSIHRGMALFYFSN